MKPKEYFDALEKQLELAVLESLGESSKEIQQLIRRDLPSTRTKTRYAVRVKPKRTRRGVKAMISLKFAKKYKSRNTTTERLFDQTFTRNKKAITEIIHRNLSRTKKGL